jgi:UDP-N-acetylglucosamine diphosphorylase / glucose-1-phosphate thymidylyltransferase / UDP-N-acetylgalactosamine diphosphorylase / glucosamine-1-phosphate N-acetyltransferase / galactosamine-1-phosphate N-acetyltransferase
MLDLSLILFDDRIAREWEPFALTRPAGELLFGTQTMRARAERIFGARCSAHVAAAHLEGFEEPGAPPVRTDGGEAGDGARLFLLSRFVPGGSAASSFAGLEAGPVANGSGVVGWYSPPGAPPPPESFFLDPDGEAGDSEPVATLEGATLRNVWELVSRNPDQLARDIHEHFPEAGPRELPEGVYKWGRHPLIVDRSATLEPGSAFDTSSGPIWIDRDASVRAFTRLAGPAFIGHDSVVLGGAVEAVSVGPVCRVRGELAESVCLGYVNKQHDGHMGHAYLGRWVNLGAETTNSDLKNNYGTIRVWTPGGEVDSGEVKLGSLVGDHVKTGIGLLLNTGTIIGAGSNLYGAEMPPKYVPPFSWGSGEELVEYRADKFLEVAERAMERRQVRLSDGHRQQLQRAWERGRSHLVE